MAVRIKSLATSGPVLVPLSTGTTVRLSPGQVSDEMPDVEITNNAKVDRLQRQGLIAVETAAEPEADAEVGETSKQAAGARGEADGEPRARSRGRSEPSG